MPSIQTVNLNPPPRTELSTFEKTLGGFVNRYRENQVQQQEADQIGSIYKQYQNEGQSIDNAIMSLQTTPGISPSRRVETANQLIQMKKANAQLQRQYQKEVHEDQMDEKELSFLNKVEGKNLKPTEVYREARRSGLDRNSANKLASLGRMEGREDRLSQGDIAKRYDFELKELDKEMKDLYSEKEKKPLREKREELKRLRRKDLDRYRKGERDFDLSYLGSSNASNSPVPPQQLQTQQQEVSQEQEIADAFIEILTKSFPPEQNKGATKWVPADKSPDGKKHQYKSDGKKWVQIN